MTPQQQAQEYDDGEIERAFLNNGNKDVCNYPSYEAGYHKGHAAGIQAERERIRDGLPNAHALITPSGETFLSMTDVMALIFGEQP